MIRNALNIITPIFEPAPGGAAQYYKLLANHFKKECLVNIITEHHPARSDPTPNINIHDIFPCRAGSLEPPSLPRIKYAIQNIKYLFILLLITTQMRRHPHITTIIHSSFFYYPNLLMWVLYLLRFIDKKQKKLTFLLDIRDKIYISRSLTFKDGVFDGYLCSSMETKEYISTEQKEVAHYIPIPIETSFWREHSIVSGQLKSLSTLLEEIRARGSKIILNPNGVSEKKYFSTLVELAESYHRNNGSIELITCGKVKDDYLLCRTGNIHSHQLGSLTKEEMRYLYSNVDCVIVLDPQESPSRIAIESILSGCNVLLPANNEFIHSDPHAVADLNNFEQLEARFKSALVEKIQYNYNTDAHHIDTVMKKYKIILGY